MSFESADPTPKELGYRFPAEWEPQEAVWFAWPTRTDLWAGVLPQVRAKLAELYVVCAHYQTVRILCPKFAQAELLELMARAGDVARVEFYDYQADDVWCRDYGPLFLLSAAGDTLAMADWEYNAWGDKFPLQDRDRRASAWIAEHFGIRRFAFDTVLEGGAIESNGAGRILTTEVVLLNPSRNGVLSKEAITERVTSGLGLESILWLGDGLEGDDTDGHIDNLARFFSEDGILIAEASDPADVNAAVLAENIRRARAFRTPEGKAYKIVPLPLPDPVYAEGERLAASYLNFLVLNGAVIVPTYGQPVNDARALDILGECYPGREIVGFDCREILREGGAVHCMSQHQPAVSPVV